MLDAVLVDERKVGQRRGHGLRRRVPGTGAGSRRVRASRIAPGGPAVRTAGAAPNDDR